MKKILFYTAFLIVLTASGIFCLEYKKSKPEDISTDENIVVVWDKTLSYKPGLADYANIIAPSLFVLETDGNSFYMKELSDTASYLKNCDKAVWGMYTNGFNPDNTRAFITDDIKRRDIVNSITSSAKKYGLEGVNIDFENMYSEDKEYFTKFIKELSEALRGNNIVLSVDVTKINKGSMFYSMCYDRKGLSKYADYIILMAYDQYPRLSKTAGPVASIPWTEDAIGGLLTEVPENKLILGIPFYTRKWTEEDGIVTDSKAISMDESNQLIINSNAEVSEDSATQLNYFQFNEGNNIIRIWKEDEFSINRRCRLAIENNLAGVACWSLGYESDNAKKVLEKYKQKAEV